MADIKSESPAGFRRNLHYAIRPMEWLPHAKLGATFVEFDTDDYCPLWRVFYTDRGRMRLAPLPSTLRPNGTTMTNDCATDGSFTYLFEFGNQAVALREINPEEGMTPNVTAAGQATIALQVWTGWHWSKTAAFLIDLSYPIVRLPEFSGCAVSTCNDVVELAFSAVTKYYVDDRPTTKFAPLTTQDVAQFGGMKDANEVTKALPLFGGA